MSASVSDLNPGRILLVDDDPQSLDSTRRILELARYQVTVARDGQEALEKVRPCLPGQEHEGAPGFDVILTDVRMPRLGGLEFLKAYSLLGRDTPVILMTAFGQIDEAVWAMKMGAVDFLTKPFKRQTLLQSVESALRRVRALPAQASAEAPSTAASRAQVASAPAMIGSSDSMRELRRTLAQVAPTSATVLLQGESGTGKELVARLIHSGSPRAHKPFLAINCAAVPENLIESELFGHEKGAFTGAGHAKAGLFEVAHGGTLLLDEIGDMPLVLQAKLLRTLQEGEIRRVGASGSRKVDVRVIAASHRDLHERVREGLFREDLLFRLEVIPVRVAPLRERATDIPELVFHFLRLASLRHGKEVARISPQVLERLSGHFWPGNIRELSNVIERAVIFAEGGQIELKDLPDHLAGLEAGSGRAGEDPVIPVRLGTPLRDVEELLIRRTLQATDGDKTMTAKLLGINPRTIYRRLEQERGPESES